MLLAANRSRLGSSHIVVCRFDISSCDRPLGEMIPLVCLDRAEGGATQTITYLNKE